MFLIDTHCHINKEYYPDGLEKVFENALANDVKGMIFASADIESSIEALNFVSAHKPMPEIKAIAGVHPHEAEKTASSYISELKEIASSDNVLAIGEIGLDYFYDNSPRDIQRKIFSEQIELAGNICKPIVLHIRDAAMKFEGDANSETLAILKEANADKIGGVVHCFSGEKKHAKAALDMGFYISFAGPITFPKNQELREIAMYVPSDRILCETDSPYLAPQGYRGKPNEPCHVKSVYEMISMLKGITTEEFSAQVFNNVRTVFKWEAANVRV